jgi:hypothetical protein
MQVLQATDAGAAGGGFGAYGPWTSGNPGIGFFDNYDSDWRSFGLSSFSVTDEQQQRDQHGAYMDRTPSAANQDLTQLATQLEAVCADHDFLADVVVSAARKPPMH